jgi:hypothetical protein
MGPMQITAAEKMATGLPDIIKPIEEMNRTADHVDKQKLGIKINKKNLYGGGHPDKRTINVNQIISDPDSNELDELGNPMDYFNIYKRKMAELAHQKFDQEKDH